MSKKYVRLSTVFLVTLLVGVLLTAPAFAITEAEVEAQISASGKDTVTGNVLIWFLCAVGFLKVSQKIDSFMASLGVNVGHTGGSLLAEALVATRGVSMVAGAAGHSISGYSHRSHSAGTSGGSSAQSTTGFFKGGLSGIVSRKVTSGAVKTATTRTAAVNSVQSSTSQMSQQRADATVHQSASAAKETDHTARSTQRTDATVRQTTTQVPASQASAAHMPSVGGAIFARSLAAGGKFANDVIGAVACGDIRSNGSITGDLASQAMMSYMGLTALGDSSPEKVSFSEVEIGGGRISGVETSPDHPEGIAFGMYHVDQYTAPAGDYSKIFTADGVQWYKQYAADIVVQTPYKAPDGEVAYSKEIVKKLPDPPKRKDRI